MPEKCVPLVRPMHPYADAIVPPLAAHIERPEGADDPFLQGDDEGPHVGLAPAEVEHDVGHSLARAVIGELPAAAGLVDRETGVDHLLRLGARSRCIEWRMLQQPDLLGRGARRNRGHPLVHRRQRRRIGDRRVTDAPLHRRMAFGRREFQFRQAGAGINHSFTIPC